MILNRVEFWRNKHQNGPESVSVGISIGKLHFHLFHSGTFYIRLRTCYFRSTLQQNVKSLFINATTIDMAFPVEITLIAPIYFKRANKFMFVFNPVLDFCNFCNFCRTWNNYWYLKKYIVIYILKMKKKIQKIYNFNLTLCTLHNYIE